MRLKTFLLVLLSVAMLSKCLAQESENKFPNINLRILDGRTISASELNNDGKPFILSFWATWCKPCIREYNVLSEVYEEWREETGIKIIAISIDDARTVNNVLPFINVRGWKFDFYSDQNSDFKRAMNVNLIPHTFIIDGAGNVAWQHTSFAEGDEYEMYDVILELSGK